MKLRLDAPIIVGDCAVAAVSERCISAKRWGHAVSGYAQKRPLAIFVQRGDALLAFTPDGTAADVEAWERRFPSIRSVLAK